MEPGVRVSVNPRVYLYQDRLALAFLCGRRGGGGPRRAASADRGHGTRGSLGAATPSCHRRPMRSSLRSGALVLVVAMATARHRHGARGRQGSNTSAATRSHAPKSTPASQSARQAPKSLAQLYVAGLYGSPEETQQRASLVKFALGSWWVEAGSGLASHTRRGTNRFASRLKTCRRLKDAVVAEWENATITLAACRASPQACSLCQYHDDLRFRLATHASASMRLCTEGIMRALCGCAALGGLLALL